MNVKWNESRNKKSAITLLNLVRTAPEVGERLSFLPVVQFLM